jgi:hypothetical protein
MVESDLKRKNPKNLRLSDDGEGLLLALSRKLGLKQTGIVELAIRKLAAAENVTLGDAVTSPATARESSPDAAEAGD